MLQGQERLYLGAVSLNNTGILLAERGHYRQALMVLRDSMSAMREASLLVRPSVVGEVGDRKASLSPTLGSARARSEHRTLGLDGMLRRASRFAMKSANSATAPHAHRISVGALVLDADAPRIRTKIGSDPPAATAVTTIPDPLALIRIDAALLRDSTADGRQGAETDLEAIAVLHNFAVLTLLLPFEEQRLRRIAVSISGLALGFVRGALCGDAASATGARDPNVTFAMLQLSAMVARCNFRLHLELGNVEEARRSLISIRAAEEAVVVGFVNCLSVPHAKAA
jgi:hypothetical protein